MEYKIIVLDDDPTGTQTVHGVDVYTNWSYETFEQGFLSHAGMFFVLTNSRSFSEDITRKVHEEIGRNIMAAAIKIGVNFIVISRGDSTLRGHYPTETEALCRGMGGGFDGEIIAPFFYEGGRITKNNVHYLKAEGRLVPVGESEFAQDKSFGFHSSHLGDWVEEKTHGAYRKETCIYLQPTMTIGQLVGQLMLTANLSKVIVNAQNYDELAHICKAVEMAMESGKKFIFRTAASFPKTIGNIADKPFLSKAQVCDGTNTNGGIVLIGSHVGKTTQQFEKLLQLQDKLCFLEFNQHRVLETDGLRQETMRVTAQVEQNILAGRSVVVYTRRDRFDLPCADSEKQLEVSVQISDAISDVIGGMSSRPAFIIAKGGITSSDVATKALQIHKAEVLGQIKAGIPVWRTGHESKFPQMPYIIFPGNVGEKSTLYEIVSELIGK